MVVSSRPPGTDLAWPASQPSIVWEAPQVEKHGLGLYSSEDGEHEEAGVDRLDGDVGSNNAAAEWGLAGDLIAVGSPPVPCESLGGAGTLCAA